MTALINNIDLRAFAPEDRATLEEAHALAIERGFDVRRFAAVALVSETTVQRVYQGIYEGNVAGVVADLRRWVTGERYRILVPTEVTAQYRLVLSNARKYSRMGVIVARNGRGKTLTADSWIAEQPAGTAHRVQCPSRCTRGDLVRLICAAIGVDTEKVTEPEQERALFRKVTGRLLLIVDEADALVQARRRSSPLRLLQDLHDACRCPIVLMFRPSAWSELIAGRTHRDDEQLIGRLLYRCVVPDRYLRTEVEAILVRFTDQITQPLRQIVRASLQRDDGGLRALVADLIQARAFASASSAPFADALASAAEFRSRGGDWNTEENPTF